jgi:hypothetical protein
MRTALGRAIKSKFNNKWSIVIVTYKCNDLGCEYVCFEAESAPVFTTEDEAYTGGNRALDMLATTGKYPNMCEVF